MDVFTYSLIANLPLWLLSLFLVLAPVKNRLRFTRACTYAVTVGIVTLACVLSALWDQFLELDGNLVMLPILISFFIIYCWVVRDTVPKKAFILLSGAVSAAFSVLLYDVFSQAFFDDLGFLPDYLWTLAADILTFLALLPLFSGRMRWMVEKNESARAWRTMWVIPLIFLVLTTTFYMTVGVDIRDPFLLATYATAVILLIVLLIVTYNNIFRTIQETSENARLKQNMQLLGVQAEQYASLRRHMEETAQARHDFRHQLLVIRSLADRKDWEELRRYLNQYVESLSQDRLPLALNYAVDAVAAHYMERAGKSGVKLDYSLRLPEELGMPESEFCMVLANLLENALEACLRQKEGPRFITVQAEEMNEYIVLIVENSFDENVLRRQQDGTLLSSKRDDKGLGLASVGAIAEKYHGTLQITQKGGIFRAQAALHPFDKQNRIN